MSRTSFYVCIAMIMVGITPCIYGTFAGRGLSGIYMVAIGLFGMDLLMLVIGRRISKYYSILLVFVGFLMLFAILNIYNFRSLFINVFVAIFPTMVLCQYGERVSQKDLQRCATILLVLTVVTFFTTLLALQEDEYLLRDLVVDRLNERFDYYAGNVGNVSHVYCAGILTVICVSRIRRFRAYTLLAKIGYGVVLVLSFLLVINGSSGITVLATMVGCIWALFFTPKNRYRYVFVIAVVVLFMIYRENIATALYGLSSQVSNVYFAKKLADVATSLNGKEAVGDVAARTDRYLISLRVYLQSLGMGIGPMYAQAYPSATIDGHSDLFAGMARYGTIWLFGVATLFRRFCSNVEKRTMELGVCGVNNEAVFVTFAMMFVLQPVTANEEIMTVMFLIFPFFDLIFSTKTGD